MNLVVAVLAAGFAGGLWLALSGATPRLPAPVSSTPGGARIVRPGRADVRSRALLGLALAGGGAVVTRWPVAAVSLGLLGWFVPELFGSKASRDQATARTEAIAAWTEMLRDTIAGAHGIEEAIATTAPVAPAAISREVADLALRLERQPLAAALRAFAADLAHPTGDLVVASLILAAEGAVGDLGELLGTLAVAAREEAGMRLRVEAARARLRTAVRVIAGCTAVTAVGLVGFNRSYLAVYQGPTGQVVLGGVALLWGTALWWLARMGDFVSPERFLAVDEPYGSAR